MVAGILSQLRGRQAIFGSYSSLGQERFGDFLARRQPGARAAEKGAHRKI